MGKYVRRNIYKAKKKTLMQMNEKGRGEIVKFRKKEGMSPIVVKNRKCLRCDKEFISEGFNNRMCQLCGYYAEKLDSQSQASIPQSNKSSS